MNPLDRNKYISQYNNTKSFNIRSSRWSVIPLNENRSINSDKIFERSSYEIRLTRFSDNARNYLNPRSCEFFKAVMANNVKGIKHYLLIHENVVNDLDIFNRNAIQAASGLFKLRVEACNALIKAGINLDNRDFEGNTHLADFVYHFKIQQEFPYHFELFRCIVEGGADLNVKYNFPLEKNVNIRERIRSNPELEAIVQAVNAKRANYIYAILGDLRVTKLVCEILDLSPASNWTPSIN